MKFKWLILTGYFLFIALIGYFDYITGFLPDFTLLYLAPIVLSSVQFGFRTSVVAAFFAFIANMISHFFVLGWQIGTGAYIDSFFHLVIFLAAAYIATLLADNYRRISALQRELSNDFEIAKVTQHAFFSETRLDIPGIDIGVKLNLTHGVGGDYYDFQQIEPSKIAMLIADISGKSLSASLFTAVLRANWRNAVRKNSEPKLIIQELSDNLYGELLPEMFATMFFAVLDLKTSELKYVNAGHEPPILFTENREVIFLSHPKSMVVGIYKEFKFTEHTVLFKPSDVLLMYTDGLTEPGSADFTEDKIVNFLAEHSKDKAQVLAEAVYNARFGAGKKPIDDVTIVCVKRESSV